MLEIKLHCGSLPHPISALEDYFQTGEVSLIQAAFAHSYFIHPGSVREKVVYFPDRARRSREHYPGLDKGEKAVWSGNGRKVDVVLDDNQRAQMAWARYTGHPLARGSGYSVRHIWGQPWDPDAFTAGWNLCYMPFWAGMLTEEQHPHEELEQAIRQASWDLYFRKDPVCEPPGFVKDPGFDLDSRLSDQPILVLHRSTQKQSREAKPTGSEGNIIDAVIEIRRQARQSWTNISKAALSLQGLEHEPFGTRNVENSAKSCVRKIHRETKLTLTEIETLATERGR